MWERSSPAGRQDEAAAVAMAKERERGESWRLGFREVRVRDTFLQKDTLLFIFQSALLFSEFSLLHIRYGGPLCKNTKLRRDLQQIKNKIKGFFLQNSPLTKVPPPSARGDMDSVGGEHAASNRCGSSNSGQVLI